MKRALFVFCAFSVWGLFVPAVFAQDDVGREPSFEALDLEATDKLFQHQQAQQQLKQRLEEIYATDQKVKDVAQDLDRVRQSQESLSLKLQNVTQEIELTQAQIVGLEEKIRSLQHQEQAKADVLLRKKRAISDSLGVLLRVSRNPPPALVVSSQDALKGARSALIMRSVLPGLQAQVQALNKEIAEIEVIQQQIMQTRARSIEVKNSLEASFRSLDRLIEEKRRDETQRLTHMDILKERSVYLGERATSLQELIASLDQDLRTLLEASQPRLTGGGQDGLGDKKNPSSHNKREVVSFDRDKVAFHRPVAGEISGRFGEQDQYGRVLSGVEFNVRSGAIVKAPFDGQVLFAGAYRTFGNVLIVNVGEGYQVILFGFDKLYVQAGSFVVGGEPIGVAGRQRSLGQVVSAEQDAGILSALRDNLVERFMLEIRHNGQPIDPSPWLSRSS